MSWHWPRSAETAQALRQTWLSFPATLICALLSGGLAWFVARDFVWSEWPSRLLPVLLLGVPLFLAIGAVGNVQQWPTTRMRSFEIGGAVFLAASFWWLGRLTPEAAALRLPHLALTVHLAVAAVPFVNTAHHNAFWHWNRLLMTRWLSVSLMTLALCSSLSLALLAGDRLLGFNVPDFAYGRLWLVGICGVHPLIFLAGVPTNLKTLANLTDVPPLLIAIARYILVPVSALYLLILNLYGARLLIGQEWPVRWIGFLVAGVATTALLSWCALYPLQVREEYRWIKPAVRLFGVLVLPPALLLLVALARRVQAFGLTEPRYLLGVLGLWLTGIALLLIRKRQPALKILPLSLCFLGLVTLWGPQSAAGLSRWDQRARLQHLTAKLGLSPRLPSEQKTATAAHQAEVSWADRRELSETIRYLLDHHGPHALPTPFAPAASSPAPDAPSLLPAPSPLATEQTESEPPQTEHGSTTKSPPAWAWPDSEERLQAVLEPFGIQPTDRYSHAETPSLRWITAEPVPAAIDLGGATWMVEFDLQADTRRELAVGQERLQLILEEGQRLTLRNADNSVVATIPLDGLLGPIDCTEASCCVAPELLIAATQGTGFSARVILRSLNVREQEGKTIIERASGFLFGGGRPRPPP